MLTTFYKLIIEKLLLTNILGRIKFSSLLTDKNSRYPEISIFRPHDLAETSLIEQSKLTFPWPRLYCVS